MDEMRNAGARYVCSVSPNFKHIEGNQFLVHIYLYLAKTTVVVVRQSSCAIEVWGWLRLSKCVTTQDKNIISSGKNRGSKSIFPFADNAIDWLLHLITMGFSSFFSIHSLPISVPVAATFSVETDKSEQNVSVKIIKQINRQRLISTE